MAKERGSNFKRELREKKKRRHTWILDLVTSHDVETSDQKRINSSLLIRQHPCHCKKDVQPLLPKDASRVRANGQLYSNFLFLRRNLAMDKQTTLEVPSPRQSYITHFIPPDLFSKKKTLPDLLSPRVVAAFQGNARTTICET